MNEHSYSAIVTSYNSSESILKSIRSILDQSVSPSEILIVDDCSSDDSIVIIKSEFQSSANLNIFSTELNSGPAFARNVGVSKAKSANIIFFDDDDISHPHRAKVHLNALKQSDVSYVSSQKDYQNGYFVKNRSDEFHGLVNPNSFAEYLISGIGMENALNLYVPAAVMAIRKDAFVKAGGFDSNLRRLEDVDIAIRLSIIQMRFEFSELTLVDRKYSKGSDKSTAIEARSQLYLLTKHKNLLSDRNFRFAKDWAALRASYFSRRWLGLLFFTIKIISTYGPKSFRIKTGFKRIMHDINILKSKSG